MQDAGAGKEGGIEGKGRANASRMIADSHDQLWVLVMVSGSHEGLLVRSALPDLAVEATCSTPLPVPQQPAESSKRKTPRLSAITTQPSGQVPTDVSALHDRVRRYAARKRPPAAIARVARSAGVKPTPLRRSISARAATTACGCVDRSPARSAPASIRRWTAARCRTCQSRSPASIRHGKLGATHAIRNIDGNMTPVACSLPCAKKTESSAPKANAPMKPKQRVTPRRIALQRHSPPRSPQ